MTDATLFVGGRIYTGRRYAEALLVEGGRVVAVGEEASTRRAAASGTERVDLAHGLVVPGLADAHLHLGEIVRSRASFDARPSGSIADLGRRLCRWAEAHPSGAVIGNGLDPGSLAERRWPNVAEMDGWFPDRPLLLFHSSGHAVAVNTAAAVLAFGEQASGEPPSRPAGVLLEDDLRPLGALVEQVLPLVPDVVERTLHELAQLGLTAVGTMNTGSEELNVLHELDEAHRLPLRVRAYPPLGRASEGLRAGAQGAGGRLAIAGMKGFLDGAFGPRTASLHGAYSDDPMTEGIDRGDDAHVAAAVEAARAVGLAPALHAIGDRAVARAVRLLSAGRPGGPPARIEHASLTPPALLGPLRRLGAYLVVQPGFVLSDVWLRERLGPERTRWAYAFRALNDLGIPLAGSSDAPYDLLDPWRGIWAAVRRQDELGRSANPTPDQAISVPEAFALYTTGAHQALGERIGGTLEPGAPADLVVLPVRGLDDAVRLGRSAVSATWIEGRPLQGIPPAE